MIVCANALAGSELLMYETLPGTYVMKIKGVYYHDEK